MSVSGLRGPARSQQIKRDHARLLVETMGFHGAVDWCLRTGSDAVLRVLLECEADGAPEKSERRPAKSG